MKGGQRRIIREMTHYKSEEFIHNKLIIIYWELIERLVISWREKKVQSRRDTRARSDARAASGFYFMGNKKKNPPKIINNKQ